MVDVFSDGPRSVPTPRLSISDFVANGGTKQYMLINKNQIVCQSVADQMYN